MRAACNRPPLTNTHAQIVATCVIQRWSNLFSAIQVPAPLGSGQLTHVLFKLSSKAGHCYTDHRLPNSECKHENVTRHQILLAIKPRISDKV